jgi:hypothetical protein
MGNQPFWMPIMADYIATHEETAWHADHLLRECRKKQKAEKRTFWLQ